MKFTRVILHPFPAIRLSVWLVSTFHFMLPPPAGAAELNLVTSAGLEFAAPEPGFARNPAVTAHPRFGSPFVVWESAPSLEADEDIAGRWAGKQVMICAAAGRQTGPAVASVSGGFLTVWEDRRNSSDGIGQRDLYMTLVSPGGSVDSPEGRPLSTDARDESDVEMAATDTTVLVVWEREAKGGSPAAICGTRLSAANARTVDDAPFIIAEWEPGDSGEPQEPCVTTNGEDFLIVWEETRVDKPYGGNIKGRLVSGRGSQPLKGESFFLGPTFAREAECAVSWADGHYLTAWTWSGGDEFPSSIVVKRVLPDGAMPEALPVSAAVNALGKNTVLAGPWLVTLPYTDLSDGQLQVRRISYEGLLEISAPVDLTAAPSLPRNPDVIFSTSGLLAVWEDQRWVDHMPGTKESTGQTVFTASFSFWNNARGQGELLNASPVATGAQAPVLSSGGLLAWVNELPEGKYGLVAGYHGGDATLLDFLPELEPGPRLPPPRLAVGDTGFPLAPWSELHGDFLVWTGKRGIGAASVSFGSGASGFRFWKNMPAKAHIDAVAAAGGAAGPVMAVLGASLDNESGSTVSMITPELVTKTGGEHLLVAKEWVVGEVPAPSRRSGLLMAANGDAHCLAVYPLDAEPGNPRSLWLRIATFKNNNWFAGALWTPLEMESLTAPVLLPEGQGFRLFFLASSGPADARWYSMTIGGDGINGIPLPVEGGPSATFTREKRLDGNPGEILMMDPERMRLSRFDSGFRRIVSWQMTGVATPRELRAVEWINGIAYFTALAGDDVNGWRPGVMAWREPEIVGLSVNGDARTLKFHGPPLIPLTVQSSTDLRTWRDELTPYPAPLWSNPDGNTLSWRDISVAGERLFYRLVSPHLLRE